MVSGKVQEYGDKRFALQFLGLQSYAVLLSDSYHSSLGYMCTSVYIC